MNVYGGEDPNPTQKIDNPNENRAQYMRTQGPDPVDYVYYVVEGGAPVKRTGTRESYYTLTTDTSFPDKQDSVTWYYVPTGATLEFTSRVTFTGTVNLILGDNAKLNASEGITVSSGNTLNIYSGNLKDEVITGSGTLNATGSGSAAGIGGGQNGSGGSFTIHGGTVNSAAQRGQATLSSRPSRAAIPAVCTWP